MLSPVIVVVANMLFGPFGVTRPRTNNPVMETRVTVRMIAFALDQYKDDVGHYPRGDFSAAALALTDPDLGWERASSSAWFPNRGSVKDSAGSPRILDGWGMDIHYCSHEEYESSGRGVERTPGKRDFYNRDTFQLYSTGPNEKTWPLTKDGGHDRLGGTEKDDIRNWEHDTFHKPADYR
jgi:hypothetical protein